MIRELNYIFVDMNSMFYPFQFDKENYLDGFSHLINDTLNNEKIYFFYSNDCHKCRYDFYKNLNLNYFIKNKDFNLIKSYLSQPNILNVDKVHQVMFTGYEMKDIIFSTISHMHQFAIEKDYKLNIKLISTDRNFILANILFFNQFNINFDFMRFVKSKDFYGFETINDIDVYFLNHYGLNLNGYNNISYSLCQSLLNQYEILTGISHCDEKIKLLDGFGKKRASDFLNKYFSFEKFQSCYNEINDIKIKNNIPYSKLELAIQLSNINNIKLNIDKDLIFKTLKSS